MLEEYIKYQKEVITRRTLFELARAKERAHIFEALKVAVDFIDEVISIIRSSKDVPESKANLIERFGFDDVQADAIVKMTLGRLSGLERQKIEDELDALHARIASLEEILADEHKILAIVKDECLKMRDKYGDERRTEISAVSGEVDIEDLIPVEECVLTPDPVRLYQAPGRRRVQNAAPGRPGNHGHGDAGRGRHRDYVPVFQP